MYKCPGWGNYEASYKQQSRTLEAVSVYIHTVRFQLQTSRAAGEMRADVPLQCHFGRMGCLRNSSLLPDTIGSCFSTWKRTRWPTLRNTWSWVRTCVHAQEEEALIPNWRDVHFKGTVQSRTEVMLIERDEETNKHTKKQRRY